MFFIFCFEGLSHHFFKVVMIRKRHTLLDLQCFVGFFINFQSGPCTGPFFFGMNHCCLFMGYNLFLYQ